MDRSDKGHGKARKGGEGRQDKPGTDKPGSGESGKDKHNKGEPGKDNQDKGKGK